MLLFHAAAQPVAGGVVGVGAKVATGVAVGATVAVGAVGAVGAVVAVGAVPPLTSSHGPHCSVPGTLFCEIGRASCREKV